MTFSRRVRTVFVKELVDIMRDRRTLVALVLVPIVLYPLLMLGAIQALSVQSQKLSEETIIIGVLSEREGRDLQRILARDAATYDREHADDERASEAESGTRDDDVLSGKSLATDPSDDNANAAPSATNASQSPAATHRDEVDSIDAPHKAPDWDDTPPLREKDYRVLVTRDLDERIKIRQIQVGIELDLDDDPPATRQRKATPRYDPEEIRSATAFRRLRAALHREDARIVAARMLDEGIPLKALHPIVVEPVIVTTPGSLLGQILPLILVLMTITGAIYPAIDLTAGERERGTLETLMVCPVPIFDVIVGKFLVVTTVALIGAGLNLASVSATVFFGGFEKVVTGGADSGFPLARFPLILLALVPFAVLFSATMIAVCSYARTFKEAQNYVTPVILAALVPGGIAAVATPRLEGSVLVVPVANMVLLTRELLIGSEVSLGQIAAVLISTSIYAAAAVGIAARVFGHESVVFSDSGSLSATFARRYFKPVPRPSAALVLLVVALLFPLWFYIQAAGQPDDAAGFIQLLRRTAILMPICFVALPWAILTFWKVDRRQTLGLATPRARHWLAALLLGVSLWAPTHEFSWLIQRYMGMPEGLAETNELLQSALKALHPLVAILLIAAIPGVCEELLFRGFLLSGLGSALRKWGAIVATAGIFAAFHFIAVRFPTSFSLGLVLGYVCWQSRSIVPSILIHLLHNSIAVFPVVWPGWFKLLRIDASAETAHLPVHVLVGAAILIGAGLALARSETDAPSTEARSPDR